MADPFRYLTTWFSVREGTRLAFLTFLALAFVSVVAGAQPALSEQRLHFTVFCSKPAVGLAYTPRVGQAAVPLVFYPTARSPRYERRGAMPLNVIDARTNTVVAQATVPPEMTDAFLLLVPIEPMPATELRYQVYVLDDGAGRQPPGSLAIINFSGLVLSDTVDGKSVTLQPGLNPARPVKRGVPLTLRTTLKTRSYQAYSDLIELGKNERALLILWPPFYKGSLEVQSRLLVDAPSVPTAAGVRR